MRYRLHMTVGFVIFLTLARITAPGPVQSADPISVTDFTGRTLILDRPPARIACLYAFTGHVVALLGRGEDMVAVVDGLKKDLLIQQRVPGIKDLPVPAKGGFIHIETLLKTDADMVFLKPETAASQAEIKKLERFGLPWFVAGYRNMAEQMTTIEMMGKICGRNDGKNMRPQGKSPCLHPVLPGYNQTGGKAHRPDAKTGPGAPVPCRE